MSWKPEVIADGSDDWVSNEVRLATYGQAIDYVTDLMASYPTVQAGRAVKTDDPVNYAFKDGQLICLTKGVEMCPVDTASDQR